jgi:predicted transcriptional regulator
VGHTITIRLNPDLADWLDRQAKTTGESQGKIIRDQLVKARKGAASQSFMRLAGTVLGDRGLSARKGFSRT